MYDDQENAGILTVAQMRAILKLYARDTPSISPICYLLRGSNSL